MEGTGVKTPWHLHHFWQLLCRVKVVRKSGCVFPAEFSRGSPILQSRSILFQLPISKWGDWAMRSNSYFKSFQKRIWKSLPRIPASPQNLTASPGPLGLPAGWILCLLLDLKSLFNLWHRQEHPNMDAGLALPTLSSLIPDGQPSPQSTVLAHTLLICLCLLSHTAGSEQSRARHCLTLSLHVNPQCCAPGWAWDIPEAQMGNKELTQEEDSVLVQTWCKMEVSEPPAPSEAPQGCKSLC